jgi:cytidine deaminase
VFGFEFSIKETKMVSHDIEQKLIILAKEAQQKAYTPYANFPVGAALITESGDYYTGCNIENISFGLTNCAERTAIFKLVSEKGSNEKIKAIAVTNKADISCSPCGACRQVIQEFSTPSTVIIFNDGTGYKSQKITELLPFAFKEIEIE